MKKLSVLVVTGLTAMMLVVSGAYAQEVDLSGGEIPSDGGVSLVTWNGSLDELRSNASEDGCALESIWAAVDGRFVGYSFASPSFVNATFEAEVGSALTSERVVLITCTASGPTSEPTPTETPTPTPPVASTETPPAEPLYDPNGPDRNCSDFPTHADAQRFFEAAGGPAVDPHDLDRDGNGLACEEL